MQIDIVETCLHCAALSDVRCYHRSARVQDRFGAAQQAWHGTSGASRAGSSKTLIFAPVSWRMRLMLLPPEPMMLPIADCGTCCSTQGLQ